MKISDLTLRDLEYMVAVADQEHFGRAARQVFISQPALSGQIKKIEGFLGVMIFERSNRKVVVTPLGQRIVDQARLVLEEAQKIGDLATYQGAPLVGTLRLGMIATLGPYYFPHVLGPIKKQFPQLQLLLKEGLTEHLLADLRGGTLDLVLASPTFSDPALDILPLFSEPFLLAVPKDHPLAKKTPLKTQDLAASEMILLEEGHCLAKQGLDLCPPNRRGHIHQFHATSLETLRSMVAGGNGYTVLPLLAAQWDRRLTRMIKYRAFEGKPPGRVIALVSRKRYARKGDLEALAGFLKDNRPQGTLPLP